jgi:hypothetical protein
MPGASETRFIFPLPPFQRFKRAKIICTNLADVACHLCITNV